jgi:molybdopterin-containing oxidoreductase family iron-sulfur binding subunit
MSTEPESTGVKRRDFLKILGVAGAATATVGCGTDDVGKLIPYVHHPDQTVSGTSTYYATTCRECASGCGVIAETRDGRTIKLEGNPQHPTNRGALCAMGQAALQGLYNPDRYRTPMVRQGNRLVPTTWDKALALFNQRLGELRSRGQTGNAVFVNRHETGSFPGFLDGWLAGYGIPAHLSVDNDLPAAVLAANRQSYGAAWPGLDFSAARLIVSFAADFLDGWGDSVPQQLAWADARAKVEGAPRFVYVGARRSLTGLNADEWVPARPGSELAIVNALGGTGGVSLDQAAQASGVPVEQLQRLQAELRAAKPSMLLAGGSTSNATELALAVNALNQSLGNVGTTIRPAEPNAAFEGVATDADMMALMQRMSAGGVSMLMVRGVNPVYTTPKSANFAAALAKVPFKVSFSSYPDETTELCDLVLPDHHALESWGDADAGRGTISLQQPAMDPVFDTRATADVLIAAAKADPAQAARYPFEDYRSWLISRFPGGAAGLAAALPRGVASGTIAPRPTRPAAATPPAASVAAPIEQTQGDMFYVVYPSPLLADGRGANKPWLQELADPVTKIAWQSWIEIHPTTARRMGVEQGDHLTVKTAAGSVTAPAYLYLGIRPDTVAMALGRGHRSQSGEKFDARNTKGPHYTGYGRYADGVGVNALDAVGYAVDRSGMFVLTGSKATVTKQGDNSPLVSTEGSARQHGRGVAQAVLVTDVGGRPTLRAEAAGAQHAEEIATGGTEGAGRGTAPRGQAVAPGNAPAGEGGEPGRGSGAPQGAPGHGGAQTGAEEGEGAHGEGEHEFPGDASHAFLPGLRSPVANDAQGDFGDPTSKDRGMYDPNHWSGMAKRRWAMTVDLARCTGCSACVTACYAENNLPTVGAPWQGRALRPGSADDDSGWDTRPGANIMKGREMTWIRLERYFEGAEDAEQRFDSNFEARFVPMLCQHCGNAPCRASRSARCTRRTTRRTGSTSRSTTGASARATAPTTAPTRSATSTGSATVSRTAGSTPSRSRCTGSSTPTSRCAARGSWRSAPSASSASARRSTSRSSRTARCSRTSSRRRAPRRARRARSPSATRPTTRGRSRSSRSTAARTTSSKS